MKTGTDPVDHIKPPRLIVGMEKALPDFSARLARRTGAQEDLVAEKYDERARPTMPLAMD